MNQTKSFGGEDEEGRKCPPQTYIDILYFLLKYYVRMIVTAINIYVTNYMNGYLVLIALKS